MIRKNPKAWLAAVAAISPLVCAAQTAVVPPVTVYGRLDIGMLYQSNPADGKKMKVNEISGNRLGFIGTHKLSDDLDAFFRLETRFNIDTGTERTSVTSTTAVNSLANKRFWTDKAWVGLGSKTYGALQAGRVLTVGNTIVGGGDSEAMTDSIGSVNSRKGRIENNLDNGLFYTSPYFGSGDTKVRVLAHYAFPDGDVSDVPRGIGAQFQQGNFKLDAGYQHDPYKDGSDAITLDRKVNALFAGGTYDFGSFKLKGSLASSKGYLGTAKPGVTSGNNLDNSKYRMRTASVSLNKSFGQWDLGLMATKKTEVSATGADLPDVTKLAVGYWYNWDKSTKFMPTIAYERMSGNFQSGKNGYGLNKDKRDQLYVQVGFRYEF